MKLTGAAGIQVHSAGGYVVVARDRDPAQMVRRIEAGAAVNPLRNLPWFASTGVNEDGDAFVQVNGGPIMVTLGSGGVSGAGTWALLDTGGEAVTDDFIVNGPWPAGETGFILFRYGRAMAGPGFGFETSAEDPDVTFGSTSYFVAITGERVEMTEAGNTVEVEEGDFQRYGMLYLAAGEDGEKPDTPNGFFDRLICGVTISATGIPQCHQIFCGSILRVPYATEARIAGVLVDEAD